MVKPRYRDALSMRAKQSSAGWLLVLITLLVVMLYLTLVAAMLADGSPQAPPVALNELAQGVRVSAVSAIVVVGDHGQAWGQDGERYRFRLSPGRGVLEVLRAYGVTPDELQRVTITVDDPSPVVTWLDRLVGWLPSIGMGLLTLLVTLGSHEPDEAVWLFGKSPAQRYAPTAPPVGFADVAGVDDAKGELQEVVDFLHRPERFAALGAHIPRGVLLVGPPGTGKTLLARAVAGEAHVPFFSMAGSEFVQIIAGVGARRVRDLFEQARRGAPSIVFVDEIDALGRLRTTGGGPANDEREQTLNQILVEMDGFSSREGVIVLAATNRPDLLDPALLRPGRFDRRVVVPAPDVAGRQAILHVHARRKPLAADVDLAVLAGATAGLAGAALANLLNEAAILAARRNKTTIGMPELDEALERVVAGPARPSGVLSDRQKELIAYHEAGHALVIHHLPQHDPLHAVTIGARGTHVGGTRTRPREDRASLTSAHLEALVTAALAGHAAELVVFGEVGSAACDDLQRATQLARQMIERYGMSRRLGAVALRHVPWAGRDYSDKTAEVVDEEVRAVLATSHARAVSLIEQHRPVLDRLARRLLQVETLQGGDLERAFDAPPDAAA